MSCPTNRMKGFSCPLLRAAWLLWKIPSTVTCMNSIPFHRPLLEFITSQLPNTSSRVQMSLFTSSHVMLTAQDTSPYEGKAHGISLLHCWPWQRSGCQHPVQVFPPSWPFPSKRLQIRGKARRWALLGRLSCIQIKSLWLQSLTRTASVDTKAKQ